MNIQPQNRTLTFGRILPLAERKSRKIYQALDISVKDAAYQNGVGLKTVLALIKKMSKTTTSIETITENLMIQFENIYNTLLKTQNPTILEQAFELPQNHIKSLLKYHPRAVRDHKIVSTYKEGNYTFKSLAEKFQYSSRTIQDILRKWHVQNTTKEKSARIKQAALEGIRQGEDDRLIAERLGVHRSSIVRYRIEEHLPRPLDLRNEKIIEDLVAGENREAIAQKYGVVKATIDLLARQNKTFAQKTKNRDEIILAKIKNGEQYIDIANDLGISRDTVLRTAKKYGIKKRHKR